MSDHERKWQVDRITELEATLKILRKAYDDKTVVMERVYDENDKLREALAFAQQQAQENLAEADRLREALKEEKYMRNEFHDLYQAAHDLYLTAEQERDRLRGLAQAVVEFLDEKPLAQEAYTPDRLRRHIAALAKALEVKE
jgi:hypothetical protein